MQQEEMDDAEAEEVIDVAQQIFGKIYDAMQEINQYNSQHGKQRLTIRQVFQEQIYETEIEGQPIELLEPMGLLDGIRELGVDDLSETEIACLLQVLTKPELNESILFDEFLQIMENMGLYEDDENEAQ